MLGAKLLFSIIPLIVLANAQNAGWRYSRPIARFPPRLIPRPTYGRPAQPASTSSPPPITAYVTQTTPRLEITSQTQPRETFPSTRSPPSAITTPHRVPSFFRPNPFPQVRPLPSYSSSTVLPAPRPTVIVLPGDHSPTSTPKSSLTIVYPESFKQPAPQDVPLAHESENIPLPSSSPQSVQPIPNPQPHFELQPSAAPQPVELQPEIPVPSYQAQVVPSAQPQPEVIPSSPQPEVALEPAQQPESENTPILTNPDINQPQIVPSPEPQPEIIEPQAQVSPQPQPAIVVPQIPPSSPQPQTIEPQVSFSPQPEFVTPQDQPSPQPEAEPIQEQQPIPSQQQPHISIPSAWTKPIWSHFTKPTTVPQHPYPWKPTTAKPLLLPSRITAPSTPGAVIVPTVIPVPKFPSSSGHFAGLMDYQCAQPNGYYAVPTQCDAFIECKENTAMQIVCPDGLHFNSKAVWPEYPCDYPSRVSCGANLAQEEAHPTANCPRQYGYFPSISGDCGKYVMCQEGLATEMSCPPGLAFNSGTSTCDWPANVPSCNPNVFQGFTCPAPDVDENGRPSDLIYKYRQGNSCKLYFACQRGSPRLLSCDEGFSYNDVTQSCVDSDLVTNCT